MNTEECKRNVRVGKERNVKNRRDTFLYIVIVLSYVKSNFSKLCTSYLSLLIHYNKQ